MEKPDVLIVEYPWKCPIMHLKFQTFRNSECRSLEIIEGGELESDVRFPIGQLGRPIRSEILHFSLLIGFEKTL